jgi:hypothetical protein
MHFQDVFAFLDKQTVNEILNAYVRRKPQRLLRPLEKDGKPVLDKNGNPKMVPVKTQPIQAQTVLETKILGQLRKNLTNKQIYDLFGVDSDDPTALEGGFRNWVADKLKDGIQKVPVINAAYSLADLKYREEKRVCSCKAAEAEVLLDAFASEDFVQFTAPGDRVPTGFGSGQEDEAARYVSQLIARASASWAQSQEAIRGAVLDRGGSQLIQTAVDTFEALDQADERTARAAETAQAAFLQNLAGIGEDES